MERLSVSVSEEIMVPEGCKIELAPTGAVSGIRLPNGKLLKPWVTYELHDDAADDDPVDQTYDDLCALGVMSGLEYRREVEVLEAGDPAGSGS